MRKGDRDKMKDSGSVIIFMLIIVLITNGLTSWGNNIRHKIILEQLEKIEKMIDTKEQSDG